MLTPNVSSVFLTWTIEVQRQLMGHPPQAALNSSSILKATKIKHCFLRYYAETVIPNLASAVPQSSAKAKLRLTEFQPPFLRWHRSSVLVSGKVNITLLGKFQLIPNLMSKFTSGFRMLHFRELNNLGFGSGEEIYCARVGKGWERLH